MLLVPALVGVSLVAALSGCTGAHPHPVPRSSSASAAPHDVDWYPLTDPLTELTTPSSDEFVDRHPTVALHQKEAGSAVFALKRPALRSADKIAFFVSCSPDARFTVSMVKSFSGTCAHRFLVIGAIPLPKSGQIPTVSVSVPNGVTYWIVGIVQGKDGGYL